MTIDERLERLTARHEALAQSVELLLASVTELRETAASLVSKAQKEGPRLDRNDERIRDLATVVIDHHRLDGGA